jgi:hypothetical protein
MDHIENFEKKIHDKVKILDWSKKATWYFSGEKLLADSKNVHVLCVKNLTAKSKKVKFF